MLDMPTIIVATCSTAVVQGLLLLFFWIRGRRSETLAVSGAAFICFGVGFALLGGRQLFPVDLTIGLGGASILLSGVLFINASRQFGRRRSYPWLALVVPALWAAGYAYSPVMETAAARATILSVFMAVCFFVCAFECWRWQSGRVASRKFLIGAALAFGAIFTLRAFFNADLPFPLGSRPAEQSIWFSVVALVVFILLSMVAFLAVGMTHEEGEAVREMQAVVDPVTGALRRGAFVLQGARVVTRHHDEGRFACLALIRLGVSGGRNADEAMRMLASCVSTRLRPADLMARMGGDEFVLLLPDVAIGEAVDVVGEIIDEFEASVTSLGCRVTARAGIVSSTQTGADLRLMVQAADQALHSARFADDRLVPYSPGVTPALHGQRAAKRRA